LSRKVISYLLGALLLLMLFAAGPVQQDPQAVHAGAEAADSENPGNQHGELEEGFSPSDFIFDHILDAYDWHILSYHDFHLSIPLPVIIYSET
jgi:hypothetical protein